LGEGERGKENNGENNAEIHCIYIWRWHKATHWNLVKMKGGSWRKGWIGKKKKKKKQMRGEGIGKRACSREVNLLNIQYMQVWNTTG
jgi:hypothetical protein